jgi:hypothetical protein
MNVTARKTRILIAGILLLACMAIVYFDYKKGALERVTITYRIEFDEDPYLWYFTADEHLSVIE